MIHSRYDQTWQPTLCQGGQAEPEVLATSHTSAQFPFRIPVADGVWLLSEKKCNFIVLTINAV